MMKIIHLQNLPSKATSENVRDFFEGFHVVDGGVHITTSYDGSVFVSFMSEEDAMAAVQLDGRRIFGEPVQLSLCSEQESEDRLKKLEEEDQILTDCQEIEDHTNSHWERPDRFGPNYRDQKLRSDIFTGQLKETEAGHLRSALHDNYIQIRNISRRTEVPDLLRFFKGIRPAVHRDSIVLLDAADGTERNVAFMRIENRRAFEIALKMDDSLVNGYMVQIMECTREDFESASRSENDFREARHERSREIMHSNPQPRSVSPVHAEQPLRGYDHHHVEYHGGLAKRTFEYHLYVKMLPSHANKGDVAKLFQKCDPGYISVRPDKHNHGWNEALVVLPDVDSLKRAMEKDSIWYEGVQLEVCQYSKRPVRGAGKGKLNRVNKKAKEHEAERYPFLFLANLSDGVSPRDILFLFGVLSRSIPRDGIIIRPDERDEGYVAFVKFDVQQDFLQAKNMWMNGLYLKGKKVYQSMCTTALIRKYKIDSLWELKTEGGRYVAEASRRGLYQQPERPVYFRSRSRSPIRSRQSEHDFGEAWRRNPIRGQQSDFGEAARAVAERELEMTGRKVAITRRDEPDFGEASRRNHDEEAKHGITIIQPVPSSSTMYYDRFQSRSPPRYRGRSRSLSPVSSLPIDESWSPSIDSSMSRSPQRSRRMRSRSPSQRQYQRSSQTRSQSLSRSYSPIKSGTVPNTSSVPQEQNPAGNTEPPPSVSQPASAAVDAAEQPRFIRVSPMPSWANDIWLTQFFSDCNIKKTSVLIKYNAGKPVHAYLECMTNADLEKACQRNGTYVGTDRICVEPLGNMMK